MFSLKQVIEFLTKLSASIDTTKALSIKNVAIEGRMRNIEQEASRLRMRIIDLENNKLDKHEDGIDSPSRVWVKDYVEQHCCDYVDSYDVMDKIHDAVQEMDVEDHISDGLRNYDFSSDIEDVIHNMDWNDKVYEVVNDLTFTVDVNH